MCTPLPLISSHPFLAQLSITVLSVSSDGLRIVTHLYIIYFPYRRWETIFPHPGHPADPYHPQISSLSNWEVQAVARLRTKLVTTTVASERRQRTPTGASTGKGPSSRRSSVEPTKITVKGARKLGHRASASTIRRVLKAWRIPRPRSDAPTRPGGSSCAPKPRSCWPSISFTWTAG
jgi:hypothetical protein